VFAWITMFAVANSALINMLMASRLLYGMSHEQVLPGPLGRVLAKRRTPYTPSSTPPTSTPAARSNDGNSPQSARPTCAEKLG
jgi:hypothetical protein